MRSYTPTAGMLRAIAGETSATALDRIRCRLRGLILSTGRPTGEALILLTKHRRAA